MAIDSFFKRRTSNPTPIRFYQDQIPLIEKELKEMKSTNPSSRITIQDFVRHVVDLYFKDDNFRQKEEDKKGD